MGRRRRRSRSRASRACATAVDAAGGDGAALAVLAPLPLAAAGPVARRRATRTVCRLVDAGVTDVLVHVRPPDSYAGAQEVYSELVAAFGDAR